MSEPIDIDEVIQKSTAHVSLDDLTRKGVKRVKVLNQASIQALIAEAVDRTISLREQEITTAERERVIQESRRLFEKLSKDEVANERARAEALELQNRTLGEHVKQLREALKAARDRIIAVETELNERQGDLAETTARIESDARTLDEATQELAEQQASLEARGRELGELESRLAERAEELEQVQKELETRAKEIESREREIETARQEVREMRAELDGARATEGALSLERERALNELREQLLDRERELARLEGEIGAKNEEIRRLIDSPTIDNDFLRKAIEGLQKTVAGLGRGGVGGAAAGRDVDPELALKLAIGRDDQVMESNIGKVQIDAKTSAGVNSSLAKLKKLNKGV